MGRGVRNSFIYACGGGKRRGRRARCNRASDISGRRSTGAPSLGRRYRAFSRIPATSFSRTAAISRPSSSCRCWGIMFRPSFALAFMNFSVA